MQRIRLRHSPFRHYPATRSNLIYTLRPPFQRPHHTRKAYDKKDKSGIKTKNIVQIVYFLIHFGFLLPPEPEAVFKGFFTFRNPKNKPCNYYNHKNQCRITYNGLPDTIRKPKRKVPHPNEIPKVVTRRTFSSFHRYHFTRIRIHLQGIIIPLSTESCFDWRIFRVFYIIRCFIFKFFLGNFYYR